MKVLFTFAQSDYTGASRMGHSFMRALSNRGHDSFAVIGPFIVNGEKRLADVLRDDGFKFIEADIFSSFSRALSFILLTRNAHIIPKQAPWSPPNIKITQIGPFSIKNAKPTRAINNEKIPILIFKPSLGVGNLQMWRSEIQHFPLPKQE